MPALIETIKCGFVNAFIIAEGECAVLVDTGMEDSRYELLKAARERNVRLIILTHCHIDHAQNARYLMENLHVPVAMSRLDENLIKNPLSQKMEARDIIGRRILPDGKTVIPEFRPSVYLEDGYSLEPYGINTRVVALPGHTDGSIGIDVDGTDIIVGDALMNMPRPALPHIYHNYDEMIESALRISSLGERTVHFGHGKAVKNRVWV